MDSIIHHPFSYPVGPLEVTGFGLAVLLSFVIAQFIAERELTRRGHDASYIPDLIIAAVVGGLFGAKVYYVILFGGGIGAILERAGFVFWGGLIGGTVLVLAVAAWKKLNLARICDVGGICVAAAYAVGRTGCWAVGDDYGRPWNSSFAVQFPEGAPPSTAQSLRENFGIDLPVDVPADAVIAVHPTQIYEVTMATIMFLVLWRLRGHKHAEGWLFGVYCIMAGIERFIVEFFRAKDDHFFGTFTAAQMIAVAFLLIGIAIVLWRQTPSDRSPGIYAPGHAG